MTREEKDCNSGNMDKITYRGIIKKASEEKEKKYQGQVYKGNMKIASEGKEKKYQGHGRGKVCI